MKKEVDVEKINFPTFPIELYQTLKIETINNRKYFVFNSANLLHQYIIHKYFKNVTILKDLIKEK